jgi:quercetin dioxygenase-like cupin family protein
MPAARALAVLIPLAACSPAAEPAAAPAAAPSSQAAVTQILRASTTVTGQPLAVPDGPWEVAVWASELPPGGLLPMHKHPWPRYAYVERGRLRVRYEAAGLVREFGPGQAVVEAVGEWHEGEAIGPDPVRLIVLDQLPPGATNVVRR